MAPTMVRVVLGGFNLVFGAVVVFLAIEATVELAAVFGATGGPDGAVTPTEYVGASLFAAAAMTWALATLAAAGGWFTGFFSRGLVRGLSLVGIAAAATSAVGTLLAGTPPADVFFLGVAFGVLAAPLAVNLFVVRSASGRPSGSESDLFARS